MRYAVIFSIVFFPFYLFAQKQQTVNLEWKIGAEEKLVYKTDMTEIDSSEFSFNAFPGLFSDSSDASSKAQEFFKQLNQSFQGKDYITTLSNNGNGVVDIVMNMQPVEDSDTADPEKSKAEELLKMLQQMNGSTVLRGSVYAKGGIHSFWVKSTQKNLIALLFELPRNPVKTGDSWELEINLIANDQNFICDLLTNIIRLRFRKLKK